MAKIIIKVKILKSLRERVRGLLFFRKPFPVFIETRFGIHTFGLSFPIDVLVLDEANKVTTTKRLKQNRIFLWSPKFNKILELPSGTIEGKNIKLGDQIQLIVQ